MRHIKLADHAGFCFGVSRAVDATDDALQQAQSSEEALYCLGSLIHNKEAAKEFREKGMITVSDISEVPCGATVLIRAHGEPPETFESAAERSLTVIDATCPFVKRIHELVSEAKASGRDIVIVGDAEHPEVQGILGWADREAWIVDRDEAVHEIAHELGDAPVTIVGQTTLRAEVFEACVEAVRQISADTEVHDTICLATKQRQDSARALAEVSDAMVVIGDSTSSNSQKLVEICRKACRDVYFVEKPSDLPLHELQKYCKIGVAASASAPARIIKEVIATMSEDFTKDVQTEEVSGMASFMDEIEKSLRLPSRGEVVTGETVQVTDDYIVINLGCKKDGVLPKSEMVLEVEKPLPELFQEGDEVKTKVIKSDDGDGNILLSMKKLQSGIHWEEITAALDSKEIVDVTVIREVKGGVIAMYKEVSGFIPMSQLADHYVEHASEFVGRTLPARVTRVDQRRNKAVFSHKAFLLEEKQKKIAEIWRTINVGDIVEGKVMRFTDYGAFVDIGGLDGLLHISEISWGKLRHPQEALSIGEIINIKILSMNEEKGKISLGLKQTTPEPWSVIDENYSEGQIIEGKVVQLKEYGAFVELEPGLDGLVHISEVAHKRVHKISDEVSVGEIVKIKVLDIDKERRRISLSIKETLDPNAPEPVEEEPEAEVSEVAAEPETEAPEVAAEPEVETAEEAVVEPETVEETEEAVAEPDAVEEIAEPEAAEETAEPEAAEEIAEPEAAEETVEPEASAESAEEEGVEAPAVEPEAESAEEPVESAPEEEAVEQAEQNEDEE